MIVDKLHILHNISESILKKCSFLNLDTEINMIFKTEATTRFANSQITQNIEENSITANVSVSKGKRFTSESTTEINESGIEELIKKLNSNISESQDIPFYTGFIDRTEFKYDLPTIKTNFWDMDDRAGVVSEIVSHSENFNENVKLAGTCASEESLYLFQSSDNQSFSFPFSVNQFKVNGIIESGLNRGYGQKEEYWRFREPNYKSLTEETIDIASSTVKPEKKEPGNYKVVLSPQAVADLLNFVQYTLMANYFHNNQCFFTELDQETFDEKFSIEDRPLDFDLSRVAFPIDAEGIPRKNTKIIDKGVMKFVPYSSFEAMQYLNDKNKATGNSFEKDFSFCTSFVQDSGNFSTQELLSSVQNGLYVNRFNYTRTTNPSTGGLTGVTRYGLFLIQNGELGPAVNNLRYTDAFTEFWKNGNILGVGREQLMYEMNTTCSMALDKFNFTSKS